MVKRERLRYILELVEKDGSVLTRDMVDKFGLAEDTVRKDFQELTAQGKVQRFHGGVMKLEKAEEKAPGEQEENKKEKSLDFNVRVSAKLREKQILARKAVEYVKNKHVLFIDGGTTNLKLSEAMPEDYKGTIITNMPAVALALCRCPGADVTVIGGSFNKTTQVIAGSKAIEQLTALNFECCVLGVSSISPENGITFPVYDEAMFKQQVVRHSREVIVVATKEKLDEVAAFYAADAAAINVLITNETDPAILQKYMNFGIEVVSVKSE